MEIVKQRELCREVEYERRFLYTDDPSAGFGFSCDEKGWVDVDKLAPIAAANYLACVNGLLDVVDKGVESFERVWHTPAVGLCSCGAEVELESFTNTCDSCGRDYNMSGTLLAPRPQWGEETGEHWTDCI